MQYPAEFISKCKRVYPNWIQLHKCLDKGSPSVSRMLSECSEQTTFHYNEVLRATSLEELQSKAQQMKDRRDLVSECDKIIQNYRRAEHERYRAEEQARFNRERLGYM
ncbi:MAG: hypothetical protein IJ419_11720 [Agathobacter sp.]|nr:hypothetical protein [Agathobacter sp.]